MADLPTVDELLSQSAPPTGGGQLPTVDELLHQSEQPSIEAIRNANKEDAWRSMNNIINATGQGAKDNWGVEPLMDQEEENTLRGIYDEKTRASFGKAFTQGVMQPFALPLLGAKTLFKAGSAAFAGAQAGVQQLGVEIGRAPGMGPEGLNAPSLFRDLSEIPEALPDMLHWQSPVIATERAAMAMREAQFAKARDLKIIGPQANEDGATVDTVGMQKAGVKTAVENVEQYTDAVKEGDLSAYNSMAESMKPPPTPKTVGQVAREIDPTTFAEYDRLALHQETYRRWIQEERDARDAKAGQTAPHADEIAELQGKMADATPRLQKKYQERIDDLQKARDAYIDEQTSKPTPTMEVIQKKLQEADYARRDLAPRVAAANAKARETVPAEEIPEEAPAPQAAQEQAPEPVPQAQAEPVLEAPAPQESAATAPAEAKPPKFKTISGDVSTKLQSVGRPKEEADAAAALIQEHYKVRAKRFDGKLGTAEEMYQRDAPKIEASGGGRKGELGRTIIKEGQTVIRLFKNADASTFIHETGHHWLEELVQDAKHADAPGDLKADVDTVRKWLGVEGDEIPTRAHERFARGFERYMMEGIAPSKRLADVFAKFKGWLSDIYKSIKLHVTLSDDIRGVYDRLLTAKRGKTIIAEEETPQDYVTRREQEAEAVPDEHAHGAAESLRAEIDAIANTRTPEITDDLSARTGSETGGVPAQDAGVAGSGNAPGEPTALQVGSVDADGTATAGGNVAEKTRTEIPQSPADPVTRGDTTLIDKAGNIRLDNLNTTVDAQRAIQEMAGENDEFGSVRSENITEAEALSTLEAAGLQPGDLDVAGLQKVLSFQHLRAVRKLLVQTANDVSEKAKLAADGTEKQVMEFAEAHSRLRMVQEYVAAYTAGWGKAGHAFRALPDTRFAASVEDQLAEYAQTRDLHQIRSAAQQISKLPTPAQVARQVRQTAKPGLGDMALELFTNNLISGIITHFGYAEANALWALFKMVPGTLAEVGVGVAKEAITGVKAERAHLGSVQEQLSNAFSWTAQRDALRVGWDSFKAGQTIPLPGESLAKAQIFLTQKRAIPNFVYKGIPIPLGSIARLGGERIVAPIHSYFRAINYSTAVAKQAFNIAANEGLSGTPFIQRVANLRANPTADMMAIARGDATKATLMGSGGDLTKAVSRLTNVQIPLPFLGPTRPLRFIAPFTHVPSVILGENIEHGPGALLYGSVRDDIRGKNGPLKQDAAIAKIGVGIAVTTAVAGMVEENLITPSGPEDSRKAAIWRQVHGQPHSLVVGNMSFDLSRLGILGTMIGSSADFYTRLKEGVEGHDMEKAATALVVGWYHTLEDEGILRSISDLLKASEYPNSYGARYVDNFAANFVPSSIMLSQFARLPSVDPYVRQAHTLTQTLTAHTPGLSQELLPVLDMWGAPVPNREFWGVYTTHIEQDPVNVKMAELGMGVGKLRDVVNGVKLTEQQYFDYARIAGRTAKLELDDYIRDDPGFAALPPKSQIKMIRSIINGSRARARAALFSDDANDQLVQDMIDFKTAPLDAEQPQ